MIKIITDSGSDITPIEAEEYGIEVLPLKTIFGEEEYRDGVDIDYTTFYNKLIESDVHPTTSLVSPFQYEEAYEKYPDDDIICITISSKLSGCYQSATLVKKDNVHVVDSLTVTAGQRILIELALNLIKEGKNVDEVVDILNERKKDIRLIALLDTLEYLKKGGRISATTAVIGTILTIKPVVGVVDGLVEMLGKARGSKNGFNLLREMVKQNPIDFDMPLSLAYSGLTRNLLDKYIEDSKDLYPKDAVLPVHCIGSTIGVHAGPGAVGLTYFVKK